MLPWLPWSISRSIQTRFVCAGTRREIIHLATEGELDGAVASLPYFAEAQRLADAMIPGRVKPEGPKAADRQ